MKYKVLRNLRGAGVAFRKWEDWQKGEYVIGIYDSSKKDRFGKKNYVLNVLEDNFSGGAFHGKKLQLNNSGMLEKAFEDIEIGEAVRVEYLGKNIIENGPYKGKESHLFKIDLIEIEEENTDTDI